MSDSEAWAKSKPAPALDCKSLIICQRPCLPVDLKDKYGSCTVCESQGHICSGRSYPIRSKKDAERQRLLAMVHWVKPTDVLRQYTHGAILFPKSANCEVGEDVANDPSTKWDVGDTGEV